MLLIDSFLFLWLCFMQLIEIVCCVPRVGAADLNAEL